MRSSRYFPLVMAVGASAIALLACALPLEQMPSPTPTPPLASAIVAGRLWLEGCDNSSTDAVPPSGCVVDGELARYRANGRMDAGEQPLPKWNVTLGQGTCPSAGLQAAQTDENGRFAFASLLPGTYCVSTAGSGAQVADSAPGIWTTPAREGRIAVTLREGKQRDGLDFGWYPIPAATPAPSPTATLAPVPTSTRTPLPGCSDRASFLEDVTFPDGAFVDPGKTFIKIWRVRNSGTCTWTIAYVLEFADGNPLGSVRTAAIPRRVAPGSSVDLSIPFTAPSAEGTYRSQWLFRNPNGTVFGLGVDAAVPLWVEIRVGPSTFSNWRGSYYANRGLLGDPMLVRDDMKIDFDWKLGSPDGAIPSDNFSARWERTLKFDIGTYRFQLTTDDGIRLWIDGTKVLDEWKDGSTRVVTVDQPLSQGDHRLVVEYYEHNGSAVARLSWEKLSGTPSPTATNTTTSTASPSPSPTASPTPSPTATETASPTSTPTSSATPSEASNPTATVTDTPTPTATPTSEDPGLPTDIPAF